MNFDIFQNVSWIFKAKEIGLLGNGRNFFLHNFQSELLLKNPVSQKVYPPKLYFPFFWLVLINISPQFRHIGKFTKEDQL